MNARRLVGVALAALVGCGDDDRPLVDAADDVPAVDAPDDGLDVEAPLAPNAVAPPILSPCAPGWAERDGPAGTVYCDANGANQLACEGATGQLPGAATCARVGSVCPVDDLPMALRSERPLFVLAGANGGDGTRARPFATIGEALGAASEGAAILVGKGRYDEPLVVTTSVTIRGACAEETVIEASGPRAAESVLTVEGDAELALRDLTVRSDVRPGLLARNGGTLRAEGVGVDTRFAAVAGQFGTVDVRRSVLRGLRSLLCSSSECTLSGVAAYGETGVEAAGGHLVVEDTAFFHSRARTTILMRGGSATLRRVSSTGAGVAFDIGADSTFHAEDLDVVANGYILDGSDEADVEIARARLTGTTDVSGLFLLGAPDVSLRDVIVEIPSAHALTAQIDSVVRVERVTFVVAAGAGPALFDETRIEGEDLRVTGTSAAPSLGVVGVGLYVEPDATATLERARFDSIESGAVEILGAATLSDLTVENVGQGRTDGFGVVVLGGTLTLTRAAFDGVGRVALVAMDGAALDGTDVAIRDPWPRPDGELGRGLEAHDARLTLDRVSVSGAHEHGALAVLGGTMSLTNAFIEDTTSRGCAADACADTPFGFGAGAYEASLDLARFEVRGSALCGLYTDVASSFSAENGILAENVIGACLEGDMLDLARLTAEVRFESNGQAVSTGLALPVPNVVAPPVAP